MGRFGSWSWNMGFDGSKNEGGPSRLKRIFVGPPILTKLKN
jgi:hypothetical protein